MSAVLSLFLDVAVSLPKVLFPKVRRYTLVDALNTIPEMTIEVVGVDPALDPADLTGSPVSVCLQEPAVPVFEGIVRRVEQRDAGAGAASILALTIVPRAWLLTESSGHRIFQDRSALDIARDVLAPYGEAMDRPEGVILQHVLPVYEYRVQWGETDHDFLFRVLSEHGLCSYWAPDAEGRRRWIVTDDLAAGGADMELPFRPASGALAAKGPHVSAASAGARLCASEIKLRDYDYRKPAFCLEERSLASGVVESEEGLSRYGFAVGRFDDERGGRLLAARRLEQARSKGRTHRWETSIALRPGMKVRLQDHPRDGDPDQPLVVGSVNNAVAPPANQLPHLGTQSWWVSKSCGGGDGHNMIVMDDMSGAELLHVRAQRDFTCKTMRNSRTRVGGSASLSVGQGQSVEVGGDTKTTVTGRYELHAGDVEIHSKGDIDLEATGARHDSSEKLHSIDSPFVFVDAGNDVRITAKTEIKLVVGSSSITLVDGKITLRASLIELNP
jgi:uncharacterized protein involved in type VI secretion and phage assembly